MDPKMREWVEAVRTTVRTHEDCHTAPGCCNGVDEIALQLARFYEWAKYNEPALPQLQE